jgi:alpha-1,2-mannosyltransferase
LPLSVLDRFGADFRNYYDAAVHLLAGLSPYDVKGFDYPPLTALIAVPVAWLPYPEARVVWLLANWSCLVAAGFLLVRILGGDRAAVLAVAACWALCGTVAENLVLGQVNPLLLLLVVLAWWGVSRGRGGVAAVAIGLATALKLWPGVLLIALAALHWRRAAAGLMAALALVALSWLPFLALPPPHSPARADYWLGTPALLNLSLPAVALRLADPPAPGKILPLSWRNGNDPLAFKLPARQAALSAGLAGLLLALGAAVLLWAERGAGGEGELSAMAAAVSLALLASPISWYHYQLLQLPGLALLARRWARSRPARLPGRAMLAAGLTWTHVAGIGRYVDRFGWTDSAPAWLWLASSLVPVLALVHFALQVREMREPV